jgi:hypothetical protein
MNKSLATAVRDLGDAFHDFWLHIVKLLRLEEIVQFINGRLGK